MRPCPNTSHCMSICDSMLKPPCITIHSVSLRCVPVLCKLGHTLPCPKPPFTPKGGSGKPCMGENPLPVLSICKPIQQKHASRLGQQFGEKVTQVRGCALFCDLYHPRCHRFPQPVVTNTCMFFLQS